MRFLIVTPSRNQLPYLKHCVASVQDQVSDVVQVHHHVQDACSTDGSTAWLADYLSQQPSADYYQFTFASEVDNGMYDGIRRGWSAHIADADVVAWLNCDEQYLEGALERVAAWMQQNPEKDGLFGDVLVVNRDGSLCCYRQALMPVQRHIATSHLPVFSAAMFWRAATIIKYDLFPDVSWKLLGDVDLIFNALKKEVRFGLLNEPMASFVDSGENLSLIEPVEGEQQRMAAMVSPVVRRLAPVWVLEHRLKRLVLGAYRPRPVSVGLFDDIADGRVSRHCERVPTVWRSRL